MSDNAINIELDPKKVLDALTDMQASIKELASQLETSLGKEAPKSISKFEDSAEKGTRKVTSLFSNLVKEVKENLKTAFDVSAVLQGAKFADGLMSGVKQVFEMERAFDKLNTRLQLSNKQMESFKNQLGRRVAGTGQSLESVMPGVETAAAKGNVKDTKQLTAISEMLGEAKATTGEETGALADTVIEILKKQGEAITASSFKKTLDALQGTRTAGGFHTAAEAGGAVSELSPYAKPFNMSTREMGGMTSIASKAGPQGQEIVHQLISEAAKIGGASRLNATLGQNIFKAGAQGQATGMDISKLGKVNMANPQIMEAITGITGAGGNDLKRFIESFRENASDMQRVVGGANETATQFKTATNNLAFSIDSFKEKTKEAGREVGSALSNLGKDLLHGNFKEAWKDVKQTGGALKENAGTIGAAAGITAAVGLIVGGSAKSLFSKLGGGGLAGVAGGVAEGEALKEAAGVTPVYVTNYAQIGAGGGVGSSLTDMVKKAIPLAAIGAGATVAGGAIALGAMASDMAQNTPTKKAVGEHAEDYYNAISSGSKKDQTSQMTGKPLSEFPTDKIFDAIKNGTVAGQKEVSKNKTVQFTNPSKPQGKI